MVKPVEYIIDGNILFLDISSSCTGWCISTFNKTQSVATIFLAGVFWFEEEATHGLKYNKLCKFINKLCATNNIVAVVAEAYFTNPYKAQGCNINAEIHGAIRACLYDLESIPMWTEIAPQSWRAALKIKKDSSKAGSASWKSPTKIKVEEILGKLPEKILSNITGKMRNTPTDLYDSLAICMGYLSIEPNNCKNFILSKDAI